MVKKGLSQAEIAKELEISRSSVHDYFCKHSELMGIYQSKKVKNREERYNQIKQLMEEGLSRAEVAWRISLVSIGYYLHKFPDLREIYNSGEVRKIRKMRKAGKKSQ